MEHNTNAPNRPSHGRPSHGDPDRANLEAYGDWVTVTPDPAPSAESSAVTGAADHGGAHQEPDTRAAQDLTAAEHQLLDQLAESERVEVAPAFAAAGAGTGPHATSAALAKLDRQLSSLKAELKAVAQQLEDLRGRGGTVTEPTAALAAAAPLAAPTFAAEAEDDDPVAITLEKLENDPGPPWAEAVSTSPVAAGDAAAAAHEAWADAPPPGGQETRGADEGTGDILLVAEPEPELPAADPVKTLPAEDTLAEAPTATGGAEVGGQVREEIRSVLAYLDQLLDALPPEKVREFAQSKHFATYKKLFREFGLDY